MEKDTKKSETPKKKRVSKKVEQEPEIIEENKASEPEENKAGMQDEDIKNAKVKNILEKVKTSRKNYLW